MTIDDLCLKCGGLLLLGVCQTCRQFEDFDISGWRLDRRTRRVTRRDILRAVRYRNQRWRIRFRGKRRRVAPRWRVVGVYGPPILMHPEKVVEVSE